MTIDLAIPILIFIILFVRHIGSNVDVMLNIMDKQTKSLTMISKRGRYHEAVLTFVTESLKTSLDFVYSHGSDEQRKEIDTILDKYKGDHEEVSKA